MKSQQGFILLIVMVLLAAMLIMVVMLRELTSNETHVSQNFVNKVRSRFLARSGVQKALSDLSTLSFPSSANPATVTVAVGPGTYKADGDTYTLTVADASGKFNLNDGIAAGQLELGAAYDASQVDPWPSDTPNISGLINLRLRRLLNAYGDVRLLMHDQWVSTGVEDIDDAGFTRVGGVYASNPTSTDAGTYGLSMPGSTGLGDQIISNRPQGGYKDVSEIRNLINNWASVNGITAAYLTAIGEFESFFDAVVPDLTIRNYEDTSFKRFKAQEDFYANTFEDQTGSRQGYFQHNVLDGRFNPNYIDQHPYNLGADIWADHSVALINLNTASSYVRTSVFYAPAHVAYLCEGAATHTHIQEGSSYGSYVRPRFNLVLDTGMGRASIGVRGPCFRPRRLTENGRSNPKVQANRLMSLRDAVALSDHYVRYDRDGDTVADTVENFDDFYRFLSWHREQISQGLEPAPNDTLALSPYNLAAYRGIKVAYERAEPITTLADVGTYFADHVRPLYARRAIASPHLVDANDTGKEVAPVWVSQYWFSASENEWYGGWFLEDYVERTLPHVFSCTRRLPGFLGAPLALTSPYMVTEPFNFTTNLGEASRPGFWDPPANDRDDIDMADYNTVSTGWQAATPVDNPVSGGGSPDDWHLARQPKVCVEDLVERFMHPKVTFLPGGIYDIVCVGDVWSAEQQLSARTVIQVSVEAFNRKAYRSQKDFANMRDDLKPEDADVLLGPEFDASPSEHLLTCGLKDADGAGVRPNANLQSLRLYDLYLKCSPNALLVNDPAVTLSSSVLADNPSWANQSPGYFNPSSSNMQNMDVETSGGWAALDGNNCDPFGQGVFLNQNGHGEWSGDVFRDSVYWNLNNKLKSWNIVNPTDPNFYGNYPTGLGFHRGFAAAWFRIPTSYPFAHCVVYRGPEWGSGSLRNVVRNKTQLRKSIFTLNLHERVEADDTHSAAWPQPIIEITKPIMINVGYYSGFDGYHARDTFENMNYMNNKSDYVFEHGIYGDYTAGNETRPGAVTMPPATALTTLPYNRYFFDFPFGQTPTGLPYHGESWCYGMMTPQRCIYTAGISPFIEDVGYYLECGGSGPDEWWINHYYYTADLRGEIIDPTLPGEFESRFIFQKLRMNESPECAPGSWHRVYAFWFVRYNIYEGKPGSGRSGPWDNTLPGDHPVWYGGQTSRYYAPDSADAPTGNAASGCDGLDQFGIWFRDDSNFSDHCSTTTGFQPVAANGSFNIKPLMYEYIEYSGTVATLPDANNSKAYHFTWMTYDDDMYFSVGDMPVHRVEYYEPKTGESTNTPSGNTGLPSTAQTFHYPAYRLDSTVDDVIFAYGPNISVPGANPSSPGPFYFRGLFHNAAWLEDEPEDETRYLPNGQELVLKLGQDLPAQSTVLLVSCRTYDPPDSNNNFATVKFEAWSNDSTSLMPPASQSLDGRDLALNTSSISTNFQVRFRYENITPDGNIPQTQSTIRNFGTLTGMDYSFDGGDSFTNIPYIQELEVLYRPSGEIRVLHWSED